MPHRFDRTLSNPDVIVDGVSDIAQLLRKTMAERGDSQRYVARYLNQWMVDHDQPLTCETSTSQASLSKLVRGLTKSQHPAKYAAIAAYLDIPVEQIAPEAEAAVLRRQLEDAQAEARRLQRALTRATNENRKLRGALAYLEERQVRLAEAVKSEGLTAS